MTFKDLIIFTIYILGNVFISVYLGRKVKDSEDFFAAGKESSWWLSGLSAFMTMFSAGTFVVWGGIAFKQGLVSVTIAMCLGISALITGYFLASRWNRLGMSSAAEYIEKRYGQATLKAYTIFNIFYRLLGMAVALYSLAIILEALVPQGWREWSESVIGISAVNAIIIFCGIIVILYSIFGGLWAVLLTDVLQFVILMIAVVMVIPLGFSKLGGVGTFIEKAPEGFFDVTTHEFTWVFMIGWIIIHYFKIGGEWAFVQRFMCVTSPKEAKKASYLFGAMYLISPIIWMLPPMMYRIIDPEANFEQAYILACQFALPDGLLGLIIASMFAATISMVDSELNVFAGVLTNDFYKKIKPNASEKESIAAGRILTFLLGFIVSVLAIEVPKMGGAKDIILVITSLVAGVTVLPVIWGMYSKRMTQQGIFIAIIVSASLVILVKFGVLNDNGWFVGSEPAGFIAWMQEYSRTMETVFGIIIPLTTLYIIEKTLAKESSRFIVTKKVDNVSGDEGLPSLFPAQIIVTAVGVLGVVICGLALFATEDITAQWILAFALLILSGVGHLGIKKEEKRRVNLQ